MPCAVSRAKVAATCSSDGKRRAGKAPEWATASQSAPTTTNGRAPRTKLKTTRSVGFDVRLLDELGVLLELPPAHPLELLPRHVPRVAAQLADVLRHVLRLDERGDVVVQLLDDRARRLRRHERPHPEVVARVAQPLLLERRHVRHEVRALRRAGAERDELAG